MPTLRPRTGGEVKALLDLERAERPFLVYRDGDDALRLVPLDSGDGVLTIGRHSSSDLAISWDPRVSRTHAVLERIGEVWTVADDGLSTNGTHLNGSRVTSRRRLTDGDAVRVGATLIEFRAPAHDGFGSTRHELPVINGPLTPAQRNVLVALCRPLLAEGGVYGAPATNADIAAELVLSTDAVKSHLRTLFDRFGVGDLPQNQKRAKVAELALRAGIVGERDLTR
jgi:pSer/pThr/pTyr-binding forkhead associated (FHA) protein